MKHTQLLHDGIRVARRSRWTVRFGAFVSLAALAAGCAVDATEEDTDTEVRLEASWEPVANAAKISAVAISDSKRILHMSEKTRLVVADQATTDRTWYAADGQRYEALYVAPTGQAFGRRGDAKHWRQPDAEVGRGSLGFLEDKTGVVADAMGVQRLALTNEPTDGVAKARISTDWTIDRRSRFGSIRQLRSSPLRMVGALSGTGNTQDGGCTGTKIGPRAVLTAAHCVMNSSGNITTSGWFNPGQTNTQRPFGSIRWSGVFLRDWRVHRKYDYAVLFLTDSSTAVGLGWLGVAYWNGASGYTGRGASLHGYPCGANRGCGQTTSQRCKASPRSDKRCDGWMYSHSRNLWDNSYRGDHLLQYDHDMSSGQSGSSVYVKLSSNDRRVVAVNTHSWSGVSMGPRFRSSMWNDVCTWIAAVPSAFGVHGSCN